MSEYKELFLEHLDENRIKYVDIDENRVSVRYTGENMPTIDVKVIFDKDGENLVKLVVWSIAKVKKDSNKLVNVYVLCNQLNARFRWVKFYLDEDYEITADVDAIVDEENVGSFCVQLVRRIVNIVDEAYPVIMKQIYQ